MVFIHLRNQLLTSILASLAYCSLACLASSSVDVGLAASPTLHRTGGKGDVAIDAAVELGLVSLPGG